MFANMVQEIIAQWLKVQLIQGLGSIFGAMGGGGGATDGGLLLQLNNRIGGCPCKWWQLEALFRGYRHSQMAALSKAPPWPRWRRSS